MRNKPYGTKFSREFDFVDRRFCAIGGKKCSRIWHSDFSVGNKFFSDLRQFTVRYLTFDTGSYKNSVKGFHIFLTFCLCIFSNKCQNSPIVTQSFRKLIAGWPGNHVTCLYVFKKMERSLSEVNFASRPSAVIQKRGFCLL